MNVKQFWLKLKIIFHLHAIKLSPSVFLWIPSKLNPSGAFEVNVSAKAQSRLRTSVEDRLSDSHMNLTGSSSVYSSL